MAGQPVDVQGWSRADAFALFRRFEKPQYAVTARVDVGALQRRRAGDPAFSVYLASIHAIGTALHGVREFGYRIHGAGAVWHPQVRLSPTLMFDDGRLGFGYVDWQADYAAFAETARATLDAQRAGGILDPGIDGADDVAFLSCLPWLDFTALDQPVEGADDCIPRVAWGKIVDGRMSVAVQVHHALVDGQHIAQFFAALQAAIEAF